MTLWWVQRNGSGQIVGAFSNRQPGYADQQLADDDAALREFLGQYVHRGVRNIFFGDSIEVGAANLRYPHLLSVTRGEYCSVQAVGGSTAGDQSWLIYGATPRANERYFLKLGTNNWLGYGFSAADFELFKRTLSANVYWLGCNKVLGSEPAWTFAGSWQNLSAPWKGRYSPVVGDTASIQFTGDAFLFGYVMADGPIAGAASVTIDGTVVATFTTVPPRVIDTYILHRAQVPALLRVTGLGPGPHMATIRITSPGHILVDWLATGSNAVPIYVLSIPQSTHVKDGETLATTTATINAYNAAIQEVCAQTRADGLNVTYVDAFGALDLASELVDGIHPNDQGHVNATAAIRAALP